MIKDNILSKLLNNQERMGEELTQTHGHATLGNVEACANEILKFIHVHRWLEIAEEFCDEMPVKIEWGYYLDDSGISIDTDKLHTYDAQGKEIVVEKVSKNGDDLEDFLLEMDTYFLKGEGYNIMFFDPEGDVWFMRGN